MKHSKTWSWLFWPLLAIAFVTPNLSAQRPSVVLITVDTLRADALPMWGSSANTPAMQELAAHGIVFKNAFTTVPLTLPAHTSLMTGTFPNFHGVRNNGINRVSGEMPTLASLLKEEGYATAAFVSSAVLERRFGLADHFDHYGDQFGSGGRMRGRDAERTADAVVDEAIAWHRQLDGKPFFVWLHLYDPHAPYEAPGEFGKRGYRGEIEYTDTQLARFFDFLEAEKLFDSSLIVLLSDHGEDLKQHGEPTHGFFVYDTTLQIPVILKLPQNEAAGSVIDGPVRIVDVLPTCLQILRAPRSPKAQGVGLLGSILGKRAQQLDVYAESLYANIHFGWSPLFTLRSGDHKYIDAPRPELYDVVVDPGETSNLAETESALANQLKVRLDQFRTRYQGQSDAVEVEIDPETRARLQSLGYATLSTGSAPSERVEGSDPKDKVGVYAQVYEGTEAFVLEQYETAVRLFEGAVQQEATLPLAHNYLGSSWLALNNVPKAIEAYREASRLAPGQPAITMNLANAYLRAGEFDAAAEGFRLVTTLAPHDWQAWQLLGVSLTQQGRWTEAEEAFKSALERDPANAQVLYNLAIAYQNQGKSLLAVEKFRELAVLSPQDPAVWNGLGLAYQVSGLSDSAAESFQKAIETAPNSPDGHYNYANLLAVKGDLEGSLPYFRRAIETDPTYAQAYHNLAVVLGRLGRAEEAAAAQQAYEALANKSP